jgi:protein-L-isoaspartate O-methyltransferase
LIASEKIPEALLEQLAPGGKMIIPVGPLGYQQI